MNKESSQPPAWGAPADGIKWGSPVVTPNTHTPNSPSASPNTPMFPRGQDPSSFSPRYGNRFNRPHNPSLRKQFSTPPNFSPRPLFHSSPMNMSPRQRFSQNRNSPQGQGSPSFRGSPHGHQKSHSFQRSFSGDDSMSNPGGSGNIEDYIHPSMFQDPWRDLPPTSMKRTS